MVGGWLSPYLYCGLTLMPLVRMSFSAMPAALIAAITLFIWVALAASAALASAAWVTTPVDSEATSGTRLASAWAETDSSVPSLAGMVGGWVGALAVMVMQLRARALASATGTEGGGCMGAPSLDEVEAGPTREKGR